MKYEYEIKLGELEFSSNSENEISEKKFYQVIKDNDKKVKECNKKFFLNFIKNM